MSKKQFSYSELLVPGAFIEVSMEESDYPLIWARCKILEVPVPTIGVRDGISVRHSSIELMKRKKELVSINRIRPIQPPEIYNQAEFKINQLVECVVNDNYMWVAGMIKEILPESVIIEVGGLLVSFDCSKPHMRRFRLAKFWRDGTILGRREMTILLGRRTNLKVRLI